MKHLFPLALLLTACSTAYTREDDAGMDAFVEDDDAWAPDAYSRWGWWPMDANSDVTPDSSEPDAFVVPDDICDGFDADFDGRVDEDDGCGYPGTTCQAGLCRCGPGFYACGFDLYVCDVSDVTTREHCGGCTPCSPAEDCSTEGGTPHCVPTRIVDFSAASEESGITHIIRAEDHHLILRNRDGSWSDSGREAVAVRAWRDTVCFVSNDARAAVYCAGPYDTGLRFGDTDGIWSRLPFNGPRVFNPGEGFSIEGGEGIVVSAERALVWGGRYAGYRQRFLSGDTFFWLGDGAQRFVTVGIFDRATSTVANTIRTWGTPVPSLSDVPWIDYDVGAARRTIETVDTGFGVGDGYPLTSCYGNHCCMVVSTHPQVLRCWGGSGSEPNLVEIGTDGVPPGELYLRVFPTRAGPRVCLGGYCTPLDRLHDAVAPRLDFDPTALGEQSRTDWRGDCYENPAGGFTCNGMHSGWPEP